MKHLEANGFTVKVNAASPSMLDKLKKDGKVRLVLKELPILSDESVAAAKLALAANKQGKYFEMHQKLFSEPGTGVALVEYRYDVPFKFTGKIDKLTFQLRPVMEAEAKP